MTASETSQYVFDRNFNTRNVRETFGIDVPLEYITERRADGIDEQLDDQEAGGAPKMGVMKRTSKCFASSPICEMQDCHYDAWK